MKPIHQHDCKHCEYLGTVHGLDDNSGGVDFYKCGKGRDVALLARWGDDGPEYRSSLEFEPFTKMAHVGSDKVTFSAYRIIANALMNRSGGTE